MRLVPYFCDFQHLLPIVLLATHLHDHLHYFGISHPRLNHARCFAVSLVHITTSTTPVSVAINSGQLEGFSLDLLLARVCIRSLGLLLF